MDYNILNQKTIDFSSSIVGFEHLQYFGIGEAEPGSSFGMLQSKEEPEVGFIIVSPFSIYPDYEFSLTDEIIEALKVSSPKEVAVFSIVTVNKPFLQSTINLVAPIVINITCDIGRQFILNNTNYSTKTPLFHSQNGGE